MRKVDLWMEAKPDKEKPKTAEIKQKLADLASSVPELTERTGDEMLTKYNNMKVAYRGLKDIASVTGAAGDDYFSWDSKRKKEVKEFLQKRNFTGDFTVEVFHELDKWMPHKPSTNPPTGIKDLATKMWDRRGGGGGAGPAAAATGGGGVGPADNAAVGGGAGVGDGAGEGAAEGEVGDNGVAADNGANGVIL
ncbi:hypothetical protein GPECTOR_9g677 [Gonium pectorale]|uniref:Myb/SANT-like domain-containing protein n=1 Tax=Gonium pectorale TaxID=33097 RepID=A0A150GSE1_GONPE|nr:hypothetical protein GPECTOR_9g677 [Gonium pectorale]|eukprot:KXZ52632.1 hypothetical protein GPECTOR_9g677 [Gonium pectorale]